MEIELYIYMIERESLHVAQRLWTWKKEKKRKRALLSMILEIAMRYACPISFKKLGKLVAYLVDIMVD